MRIETTAIADVRLIHPRRIGDARGYLVETYDAALFAENRMDSVFVQDLVTRTAKKGTVRGLHFQSPPKAQAKLVRVARGRIFDVALDIRPDSETFGRHVSAILDAAQGLQIYIPEGFAHGFCTLEDDSEIVYKLSAGYAPELSGGILWNDPALAIEWPVAAAQAIVSDKDMRLQRLEDMT